MKIDWEKVAGLLGVVHGTVSLPNLRHLHNAALEELTAMGKEPEEDKEPEPMIAETEPSSRTVVDPPLHAPPVHLKRPLQTAEDKNGDEEDE